MSAYLTYSARGGSGGGGGVTSLNSLTGALTLTAGSGVTISDDGLHTITIAATLVSLTAVGSSPNANGASLSGQALTLQPANGSFPGVLLAADWTTFNNKQNALGYTPENVANKGQNNGYASLDSGGKVPVAQLPNSIMEYLGTWAASTNTPTLVDGTGNAGDVYVASDAGTVNFGAGPITFAAGDWVVYSGSVWQKSINSNAVASVNGQTGIVTVNAINQLTGDATAGPASGSASAALTLATVNSNVGSFGSASQVAGFTVNAKGLITAASNTSIQIAESQVTNLVSDLAGKQPTGNYITALTGDATASGPGSAALTLATVNSNVGTFNTLTVNAKGLVTAASNTSYEVPLTFSTGLTRTTNTITVNTSQNIATLSNLTSNGFVKTSGGTGALSIDTTSYLSGTVAIANGGTGQTSQSAAFDALSPMTTGGDIIYGGASGTGTRLANGTSGQYLQSQGGTSAPIWAGAPSGQLVVGTPVTANQTTSSTTYANTTNNIAVTITAAATTNYIIFCNFPMSNNTDGNSNYAKIVATSGSPTVLHTSPCIQLFNGNGFTRDCYTYTIVTLTSGSSYTFNLQWRVNGGTGTLNAATYNTEGGNGVALIASQL